MMPSNTVVIAVAALIAIWLLTRNRAPMVTGPKGAPAPSAGMLMGATTPLGSGCPEGMIC